ncbi:MAG TPA: hypothetical protein VIJ79_13960 [Acidobacteriaceae bacterium]
MNAPWHDQTGLAKAATIFAVLFVVSLGLCGANFVAASALNRGISGLLIVTAYAELLGMIVGLGGLVIIGLIAIGAAVVRFFSPPDEPPTILKGDD